MINNDILRRLRFALKLNDEKVIGIFSRLALRDGKYDYLVHIPRAWKLLERVCYLPELTILREWLDAHIPADKRTSPTPNLRT